MKLFITWSEADSNAQTEEEYVFNLLTSKGVCFTDDIPGYLL